MCERCDMLVLGGGGGSERVNVTMCTYTYSIAW